MQKGEIKEVTPVERQILDRPMTGRVDWQVNDQDRMMLRYALQDEDDIGSAFSQRSFNTASQRQRDFNDHHSLVYNWGHTFSPRLLNDLVFQAKIIR